MDTCMTWNSDMQKRRKRMKKRMLLLGMAIWMAAALAGCGNDTTDSTDQATAADQEQSENATDKTQTDGSQARGC